MHIAQARQLEVAALALFSSLQPDNPSLMLFKRSILVLKFDYWISSQEMFD
jgi:hypothetical protein